MALGSSWAFLPVILIVTSSRIFSVRDVENWRSFPHHDEPSMLDHWAAPSSMSMGRFLSLNPVSLFHCRTSNSNRPKILNRLILDNKLSIFLLALLAGDLEVNPGPRKVKYPCQICHKAVKWGQKGIECEQCCEWLHASCLEMNDQIYNALSEHPSYVWTCCNCGIPNFSTTFFESLLDFDSSNSFCILDGISTTSTCNASVTSIPELVHGEPIHSSSPTSAHPSTRPRSKRNPATKPQVSNLKIININCQSVRAKLPDFEALLATEDPDIVVGTESWLNGSIASGEVFPPNFNVFRRDRGDARGGGVFIAVKNSLIATVEINLQTNCELIWISIHVKGLSPVYIGAFYRPQSTNRDFVNELDLSLSRIPPNASIWLLGDFNLPDIDWDIIAFRPCGQYPAISKLMIDILNDHNLHQLVKEPTRDQNILDLCLTNSPASVDYVRVQCGISDHDIVVVGAKINPKISRPPKRKIFLYNKANFAGVDTDMTNFNKGLDEMTLKSHSIDELFTSFKKTLANSIDKHIPSKISSSRITHPWVNNSIKRDINKKKRLYNRAKKYGSTSRWSKFKKYRREIDRKIRRAHKSYLRDVIGASLKSENTKPFWNFVKSKKQNVSGISPLHINDRIISSAKEKAETLNHQFSSVFTREDQSTIPNLGPSHIPDIPDLVLTIDGIEKLLRGLQPHKSPGPDGITARVLKVCAPSIAPILRKLFQKSISTGALPSDWLNANISPIYKKNDRTDPANYRPVSLTSIICKLLEHIIHGHIMKHFEQHGILADQQHGFRKGRSCETQLSALVNDLQIILDNRSQADLIIMDFSKAFDKVPHQRLLAKLHHVGIRNNIHGWINCFLTNRHQQVVVDGESSRQTPVVSGVPQGTVLGPLLFLIYINDLPNNLSSSVRLFADDCIIYREIKSSDDSVALQEDIDHLRNWESTWQMGFNKSKCFHMRVTHKRKPTINQYIMGEDPLTEVTNHPYLGVEISSDLTWNRHINQVASKANSTLGLLKRTLSNCDSHTKEIAYKTLVRPLLEYCQIIWDPHQQNTINTLEKVQRRAARFVLRDYKRSSSVSEMLKQLDWEPLEVRRTKARLCTIYKESHGIIPSNITHLKHQPSNDQLPSRPKTRQSNSKTNYRRVQANKNNYLHSLYPWTIPEWNLLADSVKCQPTLAAFKTNLDIINISQLSSRAHFTM